MNPQASSIVENIKSLLNELVAMDGTPEGTGAIEQAMKAFKAISGEENKIEEEKEKAEAEKKAKEEAEKARKELTNTPSTGVTVNDPAKDTFEKQPKETDDGVQEIAKAMIKMVGIIKGMQSKQEIVEKSLVSILKGLGVDKELDLIKKSQGIAPVVPSFNYTNSDGTMNPAKVEELKKTLELAGFTVNKSQDYANSAIGTLGLGQKTEMTDAALIAMTHK